MVALARRGAAFMAVLLALLAPVALLYLPFGTLASARESVFGTVSSTLGRFVRAEPKTQVRLVTIDDATIAKTGRWPWSSEQLTRLVDHLQAGGPRLMIMDLAPRAANAPRSFGEMRLDRRLSGEGSLVQAAWRLPASRSKELVPLLKSDGNVIVPAPVASNAMQIARLNALRIDGERPSGNWSLSPSGIRRLVPIPLSLKPWNTAPDGRLRLLPEDAPTGLRMLSARAFLDQPAGPASAIKGAIVVVRRATAPPGIGTEEWREAQGLAQLLNGLTPARPAWALLAEALGAALAAGLVSLLMVLNRVHQAALAASTAIVTFFATAAGLFIFRLQLLDPAIPSILVIGALTVSGLALIARRALGAEAASPAAPRAALPTLAGVERREVTALVCEIRDLSVLTEIYRDSPAAMTRLVGKVLGTAAEIIRAHRGTIENISPSGLSAIFNAPSSDSRHAEKAAEAALAVLGRLDPLNESLEKSLANTGAPFTPVQFSIGIDTGDAVVGDIGFKAQREFAAFGPALDGATALAGHSTTYGPAILVGDKTEALINRSFALLELDLRETPNMSTRSFYALLGNPVLRANPRFKALQEGFQAFHAAYRRGSWDQAAQLLAQCAKLPGVSPKLIGLYEQRIAFLSANPPARDWSGVLRRPVE